MYGVLLVLQHMLRHINPAFQFRQGVEVLIDQYPGVSKTAMRFPVDWKRSAGWN